MVYSNLFGEFELREVRLEQREKVKTSRAKRGIEFYRRGVNKAIPPSMLQRVLFDKGNKGKKGCELLFFG